MASAEEYEKFSQRLLSEYKLEQFNFPRRSTSPGAAIGTVKLYGGHFGFAEGCCKRCDKKFDTTYETLSGPCDYHPQGSKYFNRIQHPHGCCNKRKGSAGCRKAPQHVHNTNLYLDLTGYKPSEKRDPQTDAGHGVYVLDTHILRKPPEEYEKFSQRLLSEYKLEQFNFPRRSTSPGAAIGTVKLYGGHFGFAEGCCKRCDKKFDTTYETLSGPCDYHPQGSKYFNRIQHPHGCCNKRKGSAGCRKAPQHVHNTNLYLDLTGYKPSEKRDPQTDAGHGVYVLDTELVHTKKGLEMGKVTVVDTNLEVVYDEFCLPTSDIIDYNTFWSGISEKDLPNPGTKTFDELRDELLELFSADTILVGHGVSSDLISLRIIHDKIVDTLDLYPHPRGLPRKRSLKDIAQEVLHQSIQVGDGHSSKEDAKTTMRLALNKV